MSSLNFVGRVASEDESLKVKSAKFCNMLSGVAFIGALQRFAQALNVVANIELPPSPAWLSLKRNVAFDFMHSPD